MNKRTAMNRNNYVSENDRYKRAALAKRRRERAARRRLVILGVMTSVIIFMAIILSFSFSSDASSKNNEQYKYYTSVSVNVGDSVWTIAEEYMDDLHYRSTKEFVNDIARINKISPDTMLKAGTNLIVPYYSDTLK
ncbi:LysM peptidoglycan-binding domain-containing protein [Butyrivibrio sp. XPD2002]|uniref:LysM peptidoglycan-binding domain-containing protein n=1 Tax=Butyrivibrio sp. XPD2002 TaxID=1280665 RepID=UPI0004239785|nr:LysM peptidoglycan-binding domain-containing protein [Butyrivibrio sp. XPD2002]